LVKILFRSVTRSSCENVQQSVRRACTGRRPARPVALEAGHGSPLAPTGDRCIRPPGASGLELVVGGFELVLEAFFRPAQPASASVTATVKISGRGLTTKKRLAAT
jgi:hypothetical protein